MLPKWINISNWKVNVLKFLGIHSTLVRKQCIYMNYIYIKYCEKNTYHCMRYQPRWSETQIHSLKDGRNRLQNNVPHSKHMTLVMVTILMYIIIMISEVETFCFFWCPIIKTTSALQMTEIKPIHPKAMHEPATNTQINGAKTVNKPGPADGGW